MMAGRPQQLHHLILTATDTLEVEAEKKNKNLECHITLPNTESTDTRLDDTGADEQAALTASNSRRYEHH